MFGSVQTASDSALRITLSEGLGRKLEKKLNGR